MVVTALLPVCTIAQATEEREIELNGRSVRYTIATPGTGLSQADSSAAMTARRIHEHLARGEIEQAALLSNTPKRRYEVYKDYLESVGEESFKSVFSRYLDSGNQVLAEIAIGPQRLLVWKVGGLAQPAGEFFVEIDGQVFMDDVPSETRRQLRWILERYRKGER